MPTPIFVFDLDGTLFDECHILHPRDREILLDRGDGIFIPATGRTLSSVRTSFRENGMFSDGKIPLPMITQNGARNYLPGEVLDSYFTFEPEVAEGILAVLDRFKRLPLLLMSADQIHTLHLETTDPTSLWDFDGIPFDSNDPNLRISKILVYGENPDDLQEVEEALRVFQAEPVYSLPTLFELTPKGITKASGVRCLAKSMGMPDAAIFAAGDGGNDLPLFGIATRSFTPSTSKPELKSQVDQAIDWQESGLLEPMLEWVKKHPIPA